MNLLTPRQISLIVNSVKRVIEKDDIELLTKSAYKYLYLCSGFIAHYSLFGFRAHYEDVFHLVDAIKRNARMNQWDNFRPGQEHYDYYMQKKEIYNQILEVCEAIAPVE